MRMHSNTVPCDGYVVIPQILHDWLGSTTHSVKTTGIRTGFLILRHNMLYAEICFDRGEGSLLYEIFDRESMPPSYPPAPAGPPDPL